MTSRAGRHHPAIKRIRRLVRRAGDRASEGVYVVEGPRALDEVARHGADVETVLVAVGTPVPATAETADEVLSVDAAVVDSVADSRSPQGILAVVRRPAPGWPDEVTHAVVLDRVGDPGNVGTVIRSAAAFGAVVAVVGGSADPWGPKAVRASAGAVAVCSILQGSAAEVADELHRRGLALVGLDGAAERVVEDVEGRVAWVTGSEAHGVSDEMAVHLDDRARIATTGAVESLNAAMAATLALSASYTHLVRDRST